MGYLFILFSQTRVAPLPKLSGERMIIEGIRSFLLRDGRDTGGHLVPAHGHVYLTSYRIVFLGSPWDPEGSTCSFCTLIFYHFLSLSLSLSLSPYS